jgi:hypothetical protein
MQFVAYPSLADNKRAIAANQRRGTRGQLAGRFDLTLARYTPRPVAKGEESSEAGAPEADVDPDANPLVDGWPVLSDLELDVCLSDSTVPGVTLPAAEMGEA